MATSISFPVSPTIGQQYTYGSVTYEWDGVKWFVVTGSVASIVTFENLYANGDVGTGASQVAEGDHTHAAVNHTGEVTGTTNLILASGVVDTDNLHARYKSIVAMAALDVSFITGQVFTKTLTTSTTLTFSNLHIGVKDLEITGNYTLQFPVWLKIVAGTYDGTVGNLIQVVITNDGSGVESGWCTISQQA